MLTLYFYQHHKHALTVQAGDEALKKISSHTESDAIVRYYMAKSYEALQDGFQAKSKYYQILRMHPEYCQNIEIAYRLGELNSSIIMEGTEANEEEAMNWHCYVIEHFEDPDIVYYEVLKSHMALGILLWDQNDYDSASSHFEEIYTANPAYIAPSPEDAHESDDHIEWLQENIKGIKRRSMEKLVKLCNRPDINASKAGLEALVLKYKNDSELIELAELEMQEIMQH